MINFTDINYAIKIQEQIVHVKGDRMVNRTRGIFKLDAHLTFASVLGSFYNFKKIRLILRKLLGPP